MNVIRSQINFVKGSASTMKYQMHCLIAILCCVSWSGRHPLCRRPTR